MDSGTETVTMLLTSGLLWSILCCLDDMLVPF